MSESSQNNTKNGKLLPCYFCGGEAKVCESGINGKMRVYGLVEHKDGCFFLADGLPTKYQYIMESDFAAWNTRTEYHGYEQAAIEAWESIKKWNTRAERTCKSTTDDNAWCFVCSECEKSFPRSQLHLAHNHGEINYCPNCGARVIKSDQYL